MAISPAVYEALEPVKSMFAAEGYEVTFSESAEDGGLVIDVAADPSACSDCLVSKSTLRSIVADRLAGHGLSVGQEIRLVYPGE
jgi:hypothetical protein